MKKLFILIIFLSPFLIFSNDKIKDYIKENLDEPYTLNIEDLEEQGSYKFINIKIEKDSKKLMQIISYKNDDDLDAAIDDGLYQRIIELKEEPKESYIKSYDGYRYLSDKNDYSLGYYFRLNDKNGNFLSLIQKTKSRNNLDFYSNYSGKKSPLYSILEPAKSLFILFSPTIEFDKIGGGLRFDLITLPYLYPISFSFGGSLSYTTNHKLSYFGNLGVALTFNISNFTTSLFEMAQNGQIFSQLSFGAGKFLDKIALNIGFRVGYHYSFNEYFSLGLDFNYNRIYTINDNKGYSIYAIAIPFKVFI